MAISAARTNQTKPEELAKSKFAEHSVSMRLDHFVIHIEPNENATDQILRQCAPLGFSFDPVGHRNFDSFAAHFLYVGNEYLEIVQLKKADESGWVPQWIDRFHRGARGIYCVFIGTDRIEQLEGQLKENGFDVRAERSVFVDSDGTEYPFPWRQIYLPAIPGSNIEISFIQYDASPEDLKEIFVPNSNENGLVAIVEAVIELPELAKKEDFLRRIFPELESDGQDLKVALSSGILKFQEANSEVLTLKVKSTQAPRTGHGFQITNVKVQVI